MNIRNRLVAWLLPLLLIGPLLTIILSLAFGSKMNELISRLSRNSSQIVLDTKVLSDHMNTDLKGELEALHETNANHIRGTDDRGADQLVKSLLAKADMSKELVEEINSNLAFGNTVILLSSIAVLIGFSCLVLFLARSFTNPIKKLKQATRKIARGDFDYRIQPTSRDEIGELANDFEIMRQKLAEQMQVLQKNNEGLEYAMRIKSSFMANMSHEIRTPLNGILGMAELLYDSRLNEGQREQLDIIRTSGQGLLTVINDILDYSKIESGNMDIEHHSTDVWTLAEDVMRLFASPAHKKKIDFNLFVDPRIQTKILGDSHRLKQILSNLISNAIKFTSHGMVYLRIDRLSGTTTDCVLRFSIIDTGIGIPLESQKSIFDSFNQADLSTTRRFGGTGLGLAISKRLIEIMGGNISVESSFGVGSTFSFELSFENAERVDHISIIPELQGDHMITLSLDILSQKVLGQYAAFFGLECHFCKSIEEVHACIDQLSSEGLKISAIIIHLQSNPMDVIKDLFEVWSSYNCIGMDNFENVNIDKLKACSISKVLTNPIRFSRLKRALINSMRPELPAFTLSGAHPVLPLLEGKHVLLAEDNLVNRKVVCGYLKSMNMQVTIAENGLAALELYKQDFADIILMDCHMPEMDGYEATRCIRELDRDHIRHVPIIALTANAMSGDREKCIASGMDDYLSKPIKAVDLRSMLERWIAAEP